MKRTYALRFNFYSRIKTHSTPQHIPRSSFVLKQIVLATRVCPSTHVARRPTACGSPFTIHANTLLRGTRPTRPTTPASLSPPTPTPSRLPRTPLAPAPLSLHMDREEGRGGEESVGLVCLLLCRFCHAFGDVERVPSPPRTSLFMCARCDWRIRSCIQASPRTMSNNECCPPWT